MNKKMCYHIMKNNILTLQIYNNIFTLQIFKKKTSLNKQLQN